VLFCCDQLCPAEVLEHLPQLDHFFQEPHDVVPWGGVSVIQCSFSRGSGFPFRKHVSSAENRYLRPGRTCVTQNQLCRRCRALVEPG
jgi:cyclopropane fatty-acyl-phospholipid synthase-like methyltransferase